MYAIDMIQTARMDMLQVNKTNLKITLIEHVTGCKCTSFDYNLNHVIQMAIEVADGSAVRDIIFAYQFLYNPPGHAIIREVSRQHREKLLKQLTDYIKLWNFVIPDSTLYNPLYHGPIGNIVETALSVDLSRGYEPTDIYTQYEFGHLVTCGPLH